MHLKLETGEEVADPTPEQISRLLGTLDGDDNSFAILAVDEMTYIQTSGGPKSGFLVEYQEGSLLEHFGSVRNDLPFSKVESIFRAYSLRDPSWRTMVEWSRQGLSSPQQASMLSVLLVVAIGVTIFAAVRWWQNAA